MVSFSEIYILTNVQSINTRFDNLDGKSGNNFNIFTLLRLGSSENRLHSALLTDLLNTKGSHDQGDLFLKHFLSVVMEQKDPIVFLTAGARARAEESFGNVSHEEKRGGRVDISVTDEKNNTILIENKIYAKDQKNQLVRYKHRKPAALFYLTLEGKNAPAYSSDWLREGTDYYAISYRRHIISWLERCSEEKSLPQTITEIISQYIKLIKKLTNQTMDENKEKEVAELLISDSWNLRSAFTIQRNLMAAKKLLVKQLFIELQTLAVSKGCIFEEDGKFFEVYNGFSFLVPGWENLAIGFEFQRGNTNDMIFGLYHRNTPMDQRPGLNLHVQKKIEGSNTPAWPFYKQFDHVDWEFDELPWMEIKNGNMARLIGSKVEMLLELTEGMAL